MNIAEQKDILERFVLDNSLKDLESRLNQFNIFDCLKLTRTEIRHSNFLAWLLDPNETHGLNDYFLKEFLKQIISEKKRDIENIIINNPHTFKKVEDKSIELTENYNLPSIFDIDYWDMSNTTVYRELENIDLLIVDETNKFVCIIENKIDSSQHSEQLSRYREYVDENYPSEMFKKIYIYLKPYRETIENPYIFLDYNTVNVVIDELLKTKSDKMSDDIITIIKHYQKIIERDLMEKDDISKICIQLYKKHKKAIDLINKYGSPQKILNEILREVLQEKEYIQEIVEESNINTLCLPTNIKDIDKIKFGTWKNNKNFIASIKFVNFRSGYDFIWLEILLSPLKDKANEDKYNKFTEYLKNKGIELKYDKSGWAWSESITLITLEEYCNFNSREEVKSYISKRIDEEKSKYIDLLAEALNEI